MRTAILLLAGILAGCAATPPTQTATPVPPAAPLANAAKPRPAAKPTPGGISADLYSKSLQYGYRARQRGATTIFCKTEAPMGSRIEKESCVSIDILEETIRQAEEVRDQLRRGNSCGKADCNGSG